jgi:UPF0755 protein
MQTQKGLMKRFRNPWIIAVVIAMAVVAGAVTVKMMMGPAADPSIAQPMQVVIVPEGVSFRQVASLLKSRKLIRSRAAFTLLAKLTSADRRIIPGEYELHAGMQGSEILAKLFNGRVVLHPVTIPEGFTAVQIGEVLEQKGLAKREAFVKLVHDRGFIHSLELDTASLEGYLFPETYRFPRNVDTKEIVAAMVKAFWRTFTSEFRERAKELNMTVHQVLTLASVIEKETSVESEQGIVSGVFHNRLRRRIPLQSDPTVIYGLRAFDGNLRKRDLVAYSPYNTYRIRGLPPGPIANPGAGALRAALFPVKSTFLYFVSRNNGTHEFSSTLTEHNRAVQKYQRRPARRTVKSDVSRPS